ncbi:hypothetical protein F5Y18DRAFT_424883 [Xylariaceae sp. FL1019]|nr:hypothetical protein F5Y18DRAFT_424883 [Xylariaceae sp. FL1019]
MAVARYIPEIKGSRRETCYPQYEARDLVQSHRRRTSSEPHNLSGADLGTSLYSQPVYLEKRYKAPKAHRAPRPVNVEYGGIAYDNSMSDNYHSSAIYADFAPERPIAHSSRRHQSKHDLRSRPETTRGREALPAERSTRSKSPRVTLSSDKMVRFSDEIRLDAERPGEMSVVGYRRGSLKLDPAEYTTGRSGSGEETHRSTRQSRMSSRDSCAGERQRLYHVPPTPVIPRLPTPDFESWESGSTKRDFCPCCAGKESSQSGEQHRRDRKSKMDMQVHDARAYISRMTIRDRLITEA